MRAYVLLTCMAVCAFALEPQWTWPKFGLGILASHVSAGNMYWTKAIDICYSQPGTGCNGALAQLMAVELAGACFFGMYGNDLVTALAGIVRRTRRNRRSS